MSWQTNEVAISQRRLVEQELIPPWPNTFDVFVRAVEAIEPEKVKTLLDAGCGVGHYGVICQKKWNSIHYTGTDVSEFMIKQAKELAPHAEFEVQEFFNNRFDMFDVCLVSSTMEYTANAWDALDFLLENARDYVILHRLHMTEDESHQVLEPTYCGNYENKLHWNARELRNSIINYDYEVVYEERWDNMLTLVLR